MTITDVRTTLLTGPSSNDPFIQEARKRRSAAFIEVLTDEGPIGIGETYAGYFCPEAVPAIVEFFRPILIGQTVDDIPELWRRMYHCGNFWCRVGLGVIVLNGIEAALWDLKGKLLGQPVHALLGGCKHDRLPCYATGGPSLYPQERLAKKMDYYLSPITGTFDVAPLKAAIQGLHAESIADKGGSALHHWSELVHHYVVRFAQPHCTDDRLWRVWQLVETDLARLWTLDQLADIGCMSGEHLRRLCRKELGRSPMQHLTHLRLQRARHLLSVTDDKVEVIARAVGFESAFTFSNTFKNWVGCRPSEFRG